MSKSARIWYQSMTPISRLPTYAKVLEAHAARVCSPGVTVHFNGLSDKWFGQDMPGQVFRYVYAKHVIQNDIIDTLRQAEADGYDAVVLGSFAASFLTEIRSVLSIPVVSMAESVLSVSCSMAETTAVVCLAQTQIPRVQKVLDAHPASQRIRSVVALQQPLDEASLNASFSDAGKIIEEFLSIARNAVQAGADAVIPAEGVLSELLVENRIRDVDGAVVVDVVSVSLLYAEMMINMARRTGTVAGRRWTYAIPPAGILKALDENK